MTTKSPEITFVIPSMRTGGTERQLLYLLEGLASDHKLRVVCTRSSGALAEAAEQYSEIDVLGCRSGWDLKLKGQMRQIFRDRRPDVVHSFMFGFDYAINAAARAEGVAIVMSSRRQIADWKKRRHIWLQRRANRLVDCVVANSSAARDFACKQENADSDLFRVIPNGIPLAQTETRADAQEIRARYNVPDGKSAIGIVANFSPVKDHDLFVETARELLVRRSDLHFVMAGDGPLRRPIERKIAGLGLEDSFSVVTDLVEPTEFYGILSVSVVCSKVEGCPNVILESMVARTPVVAAAVGGIPELVDDGRTGMLVRTRTPGDFADAIERVLDMPPESTSSMVGEAAEFVSKRHTVAAMVSAYRSLYAELLRNGHGGRGAN